MKPAALLRAPLAGAACGAVVCAFAACSGGGSSAGFSNVPFATQIRLHATPGSPIQHVVFVIQENRSFNNLFMDYPGARTQNYGYDTKGHKIRLRARGLESSWDVAHSSTAFFAACDGRGPLPGTHCKMDGWNEEVAEPNPPRNPAYSYVPQSETKPYWAMARDYVLADRTFASNLDGSFVAHQYVVAAYASHAVDYPFNQWGCQGGPDDTIKTLTKRRAIGPAIAPCFDNPTIAAEADAAGVSWRFYAGLTYGNGGIWSSYQADRENLSQPRLAFIRHQSARSVSRRHRQRQTGRRHLDYADMGNVRSSGLERDARARLGRERRQCSRREPVLEVDGDLHHVGRLGRMVRSREADL